MTIVEKLIEQGIVSKKECDDWRLDITLEELGEFEKTNPDRTAANNEWALTIGEQDDVSLLNRITERFAVKYLLSEAKDISQIYNNIRNQYGNRTDNCIAGLYLLYRYYEKNEEEKRKIITCVFREIAEKLPDSVKIADSKIGQNLLFWFGVFLCEYEECYEIIFTLPVLFGMKEEISITEKEWANQWKESILAMYDIFDREMKYASFFRNNYSNNKVQILPLDTISEYRYRFTLARMPVWLYHLGEEEKAVRLLTIAYEEMDSGEKQKEVYNEEMIKIALACTDFDQFQELYGIITKTNKSAEKRMEETEHLLNLYLSVKESFFETCSNLKKTMSEEEYAGYAKGVKKIRNIIAEDDFPVCEVKRCGISDLQSIKPYDAGWVYKEDCQSVAQLTKKLKKHSVNEKDIEDLSFWLSSMSSDMDVINNRSFDAELQRLRDLSSLKQNGSDKGIKMTEFLLELEKHRDKLYVEKTNDEIIRLKQTINAKDESEEEEVIKKTELLLTDLQDYLLKRSSSSDRELSRSVEEKIKNDMEMYCKTYLQDRNTHKDTYSLFDKIADPNYRTEIYNQIYSGLLYYEKLKSLNRENIDYSGCVLQMIRVVEALLRYIYHNLNMPQSVSLPCSNADSHYYDRNGLRKTDIEMGPLMFLFKCSRNTPSKVMQYGRNIVSLNNISVSVNPNLGQIDLQALDGNNQNTVKKIHGSENDISCILFSAINYVKESYRNKSAHAGTVFGYVDAEQCREILLNTECLLWILLTILK